MEEQNKNQESGDETSIEMLVQELKTTVEAYLEDLSDDTKEEFYRFCIETEMGMLFLRAGLYKESVMFWFGIFGESFKRLLFGYQFDNVLQTIWNLDYSQTPDDLMLFIDENSPYYGFNKLLSATFATFYRTNQEEEEAMSDIELFDLYAEAEQYCRRSMFQIGDSAFISVMACLYLEGTLYAEYEGNEDRIKEIKRECQATYYNLSERDDLFFTGEQINILKMLNRVIGVVL
jgi:hypothetical protein